MVRMAFLYSLVGLLLLNPTLSQEQPFANVDLFSVREKGYRTNVCERQRLLYNESVELKDALSGLDLTVAITNYKMGKEGDLFSLQDGKVKEDDPGLFAVILDEVARRAGFTWRDTFVAFDPLDSRIHGNKTWTDVLQWEVENFDISVDTWYRSADRISLGISFPQGWFDSSIILAGTEDTSDRVDIWGFLIPFEWSVWLSIAGAIFFSGFVFFILERLNPNPDEELHLEKKPVTVIFLAAITFTGYFKFNPNNNAVRLMSFSWTFWALIMASAYTANLASFLVERNEVSTSVTTIEDAIRLSVPVCVQRSTIIDEFVSKKFPELILARKDSVQEMFEGLKQSWYGGKEGCGLLLTSLAFFELYQNEVEFNKECSLTSEKRVVINLPSSFATTVDSGILCTSLVSYVLDFHIKEMERDGFIREAWKNHLNKLSTVKCDLASGLNKPQHNASLGVKEMGGIFISYAFAMLAALLLALFQYFASRMKR
jgi:Ligand-gated ion channel